MMRLLFLFFSIFLSFSLIASEDFDKQQIQQRIQPVGKVSVEGEDNPSSKSSNENKPIKTVIMAPGQNIYDKYCFVCHRDGLAGSPKFRNADDWKPRLATQNIDVLTATAIKGLNAMPPKGTCQDCTEEDIKQAIQYMLPKS